MDHKDPSEINKELLSDAALTEAQRAVLLKTSATFSRAEIKELEKLLQDRKTNTVIYEHMAYHR